MRFLQILSMALLMSLPTFAQKPMLLGSGRFEPRENVQEFALGQRKLSDQTRFGGNYYVVVTLRSIPTSHEVEALRKKGIVLHDYIGQNSYYASIQAVNHDGMVAQQVEATPIATVAEIDVSWKISPEISTGSTPDYAIVGNGVVSVEMIYFDDANPDQIVEFLRQHDYKIVRLAKDFHNVTLQLSKHDIVTLAQQPWVRWIEYIAPPAELENFRGRNMNRSNILGQTTLGGRGLTGKGVHVGIWDGCIEKHPDLGNRLHTQEWESPSEHGQHTSGTILGAGILDPKAKGMAPKAELYAWNFNGTINGLSTPQEMQISAEEHGVVVTSNSYGFSMRNFCSKPYVYSAEDSQLDQLVNMYPTLTHVFSVGNDQETCDHPYASSTKRAKNSIMVGAQGDNGEISWFSSFGPTNDGRIIPHITAYGVDVWSTVYQNGYDFMSGTSMACPNASGAITLLYERYNAIYNEFPNAALVKAAVMNTAEDKGNPGPDYVYGYGQLDALRAVEMIEKQHFMMGTIENGETKTHTINVPANAAELRVMVVWTDYWGTTDENNKNLINDIDLSVTKGGETYQPWILDPSVPNKDATTGKDHLNNQEQVTLKNPVAGEYTITLEGFEIPKGPQDYALVYEWYTPHIQVIYPNGGEAFNPGDTINARWNCLGYTGNYVLQLSTDDGATYTTVARDIPNQQKNHLVVMPESPTGKALLRVVVDGTMDMSDAQFAIMSTPQNLKLTAADCGGDGWSLSWDAVPGAQTYAVLQADDEQGEFFKIADATSNSCNLPQLGYGRNIFAVQAVGENNELSQRSLGIMANPSLPIDLDQTGLPVEENLEEFPSPFLRVTNGKAIDVSYTQTVFQYGHAHTLHLQPNGNADAAAWNSTGDLFDNNPDYLTSAKFCNIDASKITGQLWARLVLGMDSQSSSGKFRVLVDGEERANTLGEKQISKVEPMKNILYYDLSDKAGSQFSLEFQSVLKSPRDTIVLGHFRLWQARHDVGISEVILPKPADNLTYSEPVKIKVRNFSGEKLQNVKVSYTLNGTDLVEETLPNPLEPFATMEYTFNQKVDMSQVEVLYEVEAKVEIPDDDTPANNTRKAQTTHFGDYYRMPVGQFGNTQWTVSSTPKIFTDDQGKLLNYSNNCEGVQVIKPSGTNKKVKIKFLEFNTEKGRDALQIRDGNTTSSPVICTLTGNISAIPDSLPFEIISTDQFGQLCFINLTDGQETAPGWIAEVSEVDPPAEDPSNRFTVALGYDLDGNYTEGKTVSMRITNKGEAISGVKVRYKVNNGEWVSETISETIPKHSKSSYGSYDYYTYNFKQKLTLPESQAQFELTVAIDEHDEFDGDNVATASVKNYKYCVCSTTFSTYQEAGFYITSVQKDDVNNYSGDQGDRYGTKYDIAFDLYKDLTNELLITVNKYQANGKIAVFIDWDNNYNFDGTNEVIRLDAVSGQTTYTIPITIPEGTEPGDYYMRVRVANYDGQNGPMDACTSLWNGGQYGYGTVYGESEDYKLKVWEQYPIQIDVEPVSTTLASGVGLTASEEVTVTIQNYGAKEASNFEVGLKVDETDEVVETVSGPIPAFGSLDFTFDAKADLSAPGKHTVVITTKLTGDTNAENNTLTISVLNEVPATDGSFALRFDGRDDVVEVGTLNNTNLQSFTYETWFNHNTYGSYGTPGFGRFFEGKGATIFFNGYKHQYYPDSCLVLSIGNGSVHTNKASITSPGTWQHLAVTFDNSTKTVKVYLNGEELEVSVSVFKDGERPITSMPDNSSNTLYIGNSANLDRQFNGMMDVVRVWSVVRSKQEIVDNMNQSDLSGQTGLVAQFLFDEGFNNHGLHSTTGDFVAQIHNANVEEGANSIWVEMKPEFTSFELADQVIDWLPVTGEPNHFETQIKNESGVELSSQAATFTTNFANAQVKKNGSEVTSGETFDFSSSGTTPLQFDLSCTHMGKELTNTYYFKAEVEKSPDCNLLTFSIPSLSFTPSTIQSTMTHVVDAIVDLTQLETKFTVSEGATLWLGETEIASGAKIDYSQPVVLRVLAANKRATNYYTILLKKSQVITWNPELNKTYGDADFDLDAVNSSGAPIDYQSSNPLVISIVQNKAQIHAVGNATITASQFGGNGLEPAEPVQKEFFVAKKDLTITADDKTINFTEPIPELTMSFEGFVNGDDESVLDELPTISTTAKQNVSPAGDYDITLSGGSDNNYNFILNNGKLHIVDVQTHTLTFEVTYNGLPDAGVTIEINHATYTTDESGKQAVVLMPGTYSYTLTKDGREPVEGEVQIVDADINLPIAMTDPLPIYTIAYTTDGHGFIEGETTQQVKQGTDGTEVTAKPNSGYLFDEWSDGLQTTTRHETNVQSDLNLQAKFKLKTYTLTYDAGSNGTISGEATQTVAHGGNGTEVTVVPNSGYFFVQWSDGRTDNPRIDNNVMGDVNVTAQYSKIYTLPYTQTFDTDQLPTGWTNVDNLGGNKIWEFKAQGNYDWDKLEGSEPNSAFFDEDTYGSGKKNADLISPFFNLSSNTSVKVKFNHYFKQWSGTVASFQYCINGVDWIEVKHWKDADTENPEVFEQVVDAVAGQSSVRFKWNYTFNGYSYGYYWIVDDIEITGEGSATTHTLTYTAGEGGTISGEATQTVAHGGNGTEVEAVPNSGYHFVQWSDGLTTAKRTETNVTQDLTFEAQFEQDAAPTTHTLTYTAGEGGTISGEATQTVAHGGSGTEVEAVPNSGYHFVQWSDGLTTAKRTETNVTQDLTLEAQFEQDAAPTTHTLTYTAGEGGTISGEATQTVAHGGNGTEVEAVPNSGYHFVQWSDGLTTAKRTETNVTQDLTLEAQFEQDAAPTTHTLTYTAGEGGTISGEATQTVAHGGSGTEVEAVPNSGYHFVQWSDGLTTAKRTETNVTQDLTFEAQFDSNVGVDANALSDAKVYPNPFSDRLMLTNITGVSRITLHNAVGQQVISIVHDGSDELMVNTSTLQPGIYLLTIYKSNDYKITSIVIKN